MMPHLLNSILFSAVFLLVYLFALKKETFFKANRSYLLLAPILATILPILSFDFLKIGARETSVTVLPENWLSELSIHGHGDIIHPVSGSLWSTSHLIWMVYTIGVLISLLLFIRKYKTFLRLKKSGKHCQYHAENIICLPDSHAALTFFKTIFIGDKFSETEIETVLYHEKIHCKEKHSWDLLYYEVLKIVFWFNPFIYFMQNQIRELHEFIADQKTSSFQNKKSYTESLLNAAFGTHRLSFINSFFSKNTLKTRILMLYKTKSNRLSSFKFLIVIPVLFLMLIYVACSDNTQSEEQPAAASYKQATINDSTDKTQEIPFQVLDKSPSFPNSEDFQDNKEAKKAFSKHIAAFVNENFDTKTADWDSLSKKTVRIAAQFTVDPNGEITNIRARSAQGALEDEAVRVLKNLPQMKPGEMDGQPVKVVYNLPIVFQTN